MRVITENTCRALIAVVLLMSCHTAIGAEQRRLQISTSVIARAEINQPVDVLVMLDDSADRQVLAYSLPTQQQPHELRGAEYGRYISERARLLRGSKQSILTELANDDLELVADYAVLPVMHMRLRNTWALERLKAHSRILSIDEIRTTRPTLTQSLPLINQPSVQTAGYAGTGTTVCVLDSGVDYTRTAFGSCTSPGAPSGCKVVAAVDIAANDGMLDDPAVGRHGTNVAATVLGVAPNARIAALDVFSGQTASSNDILSGINWCITNRATYNIVAINMSLGGGRYYNSISPTDSVGTALQNARNAGIATIVASGNEAYTDSMAWPAAYSNVISVGAVYDSAFGSVGYSGCSDATTAADKVTCFSNSVSFLSMLAPGASIDAGAITMSGTSQAAPHVAGAVAVLAAAHPAEDTNTRIGRLAQGVTVTDTRNGISKPRLDLAAAVAISDPEPEPDHGDCATTNCSESYGGWRIGLGLR